MSAPWVTSQNLFVPIRSLKPPSAECGHMSIFKNRTGRYLWTCRLRLCQRYPQSDSLLEETQIKQTLPHGLQVLEQSCKGEFAAARGDCGLMPSRAGRACPLGPHPTTTSWALVTAWRPPHKDSPTTHQADPLPLLGPCSSLLLQHLWRFTHAPPDGCRVAPASRQNPFVSFTRPSIVLFYFFFRNMNVAFIRCQPLLTAPRFRDGCCGHSAEPVSEPRSLKRLVPMRPSSGVHCPHCCSASMSRVGAERFILHLLIHPSPTLANSMHSY